jgi:ABC-2 type transport system ATP-binding protein
MRELQTEGTTLILSSHDMAEVEKMADRVAILLHGKIVASGTPNDLTRTGAGFTKISIQTEKGHLSEPATLPAVVQKTAKEGYDIYYSSDPAATIMAILETIKTHDDALIDLRVERPSLEDRFLEITADKEATR